MNSDPLIELWNSAANRPEADAWQLLAARFVSRLRRRRRFQACWLAWTGFLMTVVSGLVVAHIARKGFESLVDQWTLVPMVVLPWLVLGYFVRSFFRRGSVSGAAGQPLRIVIAAAQESNTAERRHLRIVAGFFAVMAPVTAIAVWQLHAAGKVPGNQVWSMASAFALIFTLGFIAILTRYRRQLVPEQRTLDALQHDLDGPVAS